MDPGPIIGIVLGIPALAFSIRLVTKPFIDGWVRARELKAGAPPTVSPAFEPQRDERIHQLEAEVASLRQARDALGGGEADTAPLDEGPSPIDELAQELGIADSEAS